MSASTKSVARLVSNSFGIIADSGGLQEEAACATKRPLICRDATERPETIECGLGKLIDANAVDDVNFKLIATSIASPRFRAQKPIACLSVSAMAPCVMRNEMVGFPSHTHNSGHVVCIPLLCPQDTTGSHTDLYIYIGIHGILTTTTSA